jgi:hypothetical protein
MCSIIAYILEIDENLNCLIRTIQIYVPKIPHSNYSNIYIWSENYVN